MGFCPTLTQVTYYLLTGNLLTISLRSGETLSLPITQEQGREKVAQVWHICSGVTGVIEIAVLESLVVKEKSAWGHIQIHYRFKRNVNTVEGK